MKKVLLIVLSLILMLGLVACSNNSNNIYTTTFKARIVESNGDTVIVEPLENEEIRRSADKISVGIGNVKKYVPEVLPVGTLVEIVYDGNVNETYPAQINVLGFRTIMEESEIPTVVAYANWVDSSVAFESDEKCLNVDKYIFSDFSRLPTFKFDTKAELDEFKNKYKDVFTMDQGYNEVDSFNDATANYDDEFFNNHSLMLTYKEASSGSFRYGISEVKKDNGVLVIKVVKTNNPEVYTDDMSGWFLMAEVEKDYIKDCKEFDTQVWDEFSYGVVTIDSNKVTINNGKNDYDSSNFGRIESFVFNTNNGIDDEIEITQYTTEGDPIITTIKYNSADGSFKVIEDATQDKFGVQKVYNNVYDSSYKARIIAVDGDNIAYYDFNLVSGENEVHICRYSY